MTPASCRVDHSLHTRARPSTTTPNPANRRPDRNRERFPFLFPVFSPLARHGQVVVRRRASRFLSSRAARGAPQRAWIAACLPERSIQSDPPRHTTPHAHAPLALRLLLRLAQRVSLHPIPTPRATRDFARACVRARVVGGLATARLAVSHRRERDEKRGAMRRALRCGFFAFWLGLDRGGGWGVGAEAQSVSASVLARFHISAVAFSAGVETFPLHMPACTLSWLPSAPQATLHPLPGTDFRVGAPDNKGMVKPK